MGKYHLDTDTLIEVKNGAYAFEIAPSFWVSLEELLKSKTLCMCRLVYDELAAGDDDLAAWVQRFKDLGCIINPDENTQKIFAEIADYVSNKYPPHKASMFLSGADPWIIAHAKTENSIVVTHEVIVTSSSTKVKIPNICDVFNVSYVSLFQMMKDLKIQIGKSA